MSVVLLTVFPPYDALTVTVVLPFANAFMAPVALFIVATLLSPISQVYAGEDVGNPSAATSGYIPFCPLRKSCGEDGLYSKLSTRTVFCCVTTRPSKSVALISTVATPPEDAVTLAVVPD